MQYENILLFAQLGCHQKGDELASKKQWGLLISCLAFSIFLYSRLSLEYLKNKRVIWLEDYLFKTVEVNNFTVKIEINESSYKNFCAQRQLNE